METPEKTTMTPEEVAASAGMRLTEFERFVEAGVVVPDAGGRFGEADIARLRLVRSLAESGLALDEMKVAIESGRLSFGYVEQLMPHPVRLVAPPADDSEIGALRWEALLAPILGTNRRPGESLREDDMRLYEMMERANEIGIPLERVVQLVRSFAQTVSRLVDMQREFVDEVLLQPAIEETGSPIAALEATSEVRYEYRHLGRATVFELLDRAMDDAIFRNMVQLTEIALERVGVGQSAASDGVAFIDISEYSYLSELHGDDAAAAQGSRLAGLVQDLAREHGTRLVKSLGDGALVHGPTVNGVLGVALDAIDMAEERNIWPLHAGVNVGRVVPRDGDLFGSAVNVASRLADQARPGQVVVSRAVVDALGDHSDVQIEPTGIARLKNISEPVELFVITRDGSAGID